MGWRRSWRGWCRGRGVWPGSPTWRARSCRRPGGSTRWWRCSERGAGWRRCRSPCWPGSRSSRYRPTAEVTRHVTTRDPHCRFPGCTRPSRHCDLDHVTPFNHANPHTGGPTTPDNLIPLCRHHLTKHHAGWHIGYNNRTGHVTWTAPTGHTYTDQPVLTA
ncbi:hypothetical protein ABH941_006194 [Streptacidiphilus sp. EB103A]